MKKVLIKLLSIEDVRNFVNIVSKYDTDMDLKSGRYTIDAKSLMGIFSLDLLKPIELIIHADDAKAETILTDLNKFMVENV